MVSNSRNEEGFYLLRKLRDCYESTQALAEDLVRNLGFNSNSSGGVVNSFTTPTVDDRDKIWNKLNADGESQGLYFFQKGVWVAIPSAVETQ